MKKTLLLFSLLCCLLAGGAAVAQSIELTAPAGSGQFGRSITVLTNGNYVVTDPSWDNGAIADVGAVYLYNGQTHALISTLTGSQAGDRVGSNGVTALSNGNYVVISTSWKNGTATNAGAVTWGSRTAGVSGVVSSSNSLVGSTADDQVGSDGVTALSNGNYVVISSFWDNGTTATDAGAVTWCDGTTGRVGAVSSSNSLVGSTANNFVGDGNVTALTNGNYVVRSLEWDNGAATNAGAITWGSGTAGVSGVVSSSNSLVGSTASDRVGNLGVIALSNGNYVVLSPAWDNGATAIDAGAVTWCDGITGRFGAVSGSNSLVGSRADDLVGSSGVTALTNGNYVVRSANWGNGATATNAGAVTWCDGTAGVVGVVSSSNSLVGSTANDNVGSGVTALSNGNYVVHSPNWDNGATADVGAVTWCDGNTGRFGAVSSSNSLVGSRNSDRVGSVTPLSNGNYVVSSPNWANGTTATNAGAVTWCDGITGRVGAVSSSNSLVGSTANDNVGGTGVTALSNGNYVVRSPNWDNGTTATNAGAVTWGSNTAGVSGVVSSSNSLVGSTANDNVGGTGVTALSNGNYVVGSRDWDNGTTADVGAVTWCDGTTGRFGAVSSSNSLVGSRTSDRLGLDGVTALSNGNYVVRSPAWDNGATTDVGAVTWCDGTTGRFGAVSSSNSLVGSRANDNVGITGVTALSNGNYVVRTNNWDNGATTDAGAVTWGSGTAGVVGVVSSSNSLVGSTASDNVGNSGVTALSNGNYVVRSTSWNNGTTTDAGAYSFGIGTVGLNGTINACNSVLGIASNDVNFNSSLANNTLYDYSIVGLYAQNKVYIFKKGTEALASAATTQTLSIAGTSGTTHFIDNSCNLIASVTQAGASPIAGSTTAKVWIDGTQAIQFVKRHFEITPANNAGTATGKVTLYFTQAEFNAFNGQVPAPALLMPANPTDNTGIANLKIEKREGTSSDGTGNPSTYSGSPTIIDPTDTDIVWNSVQNRWEVSFDVTGFGGFWAKVPSPACTAPTAYNVTGGGSYCAGGTGVAIGLANSETGVTYQLKRGTTDVSTQSGTTGQPISFGNQTTAGTYTVVATGTTGGCTATMTGSAVVTVYTPVTKTWVGTTNNWNTASNWNPSGVPHECDNVIISSSSQVPVISTTVSRIGTTTINQGRSISINTGGTFNNTGAITVNGLIDIGGTSGTGTLNNNSPGTITVNGVDANRGDGYLLVRMNSPGIGTLNNNSGATITLNNYAYLEISPNNTVTNAGTINNNSNCLLWVKGELSGAGSINNSSGAITGNGGVVSGSLYTSPVGSTIHFPYAEMGEYNCLSFNNGLTNAGNILFQIGGTTSCTQYDKITVTGTATLGGTFSAQLINGYNPPLNTTFDVITATAISGTFTNNSINLGGGKYANMYYTATKATIKIENAPLGSTPTVNLSVSTNTGTEATATVVTVTATASVAVSGAQTVSLGVSGTGITAGDYSLSSTTITIPTGQTTGTVTFTVVDDAVIEGAETATLTISSPSSGISLGSTTTQNITITDNDFPTVNLSVSANAGTEAAATSITVTATASAAVSGAQTVSLAVTGTGITAGDYSLSSTTITIPTGQTTGTVTFTVVDDALVEGTETAVLTISTPSSGISLGSTTTQNITITDNDFPTVNLSVSANAGTEAAATSITVTATASAAVSGAQTVNLAVTGTGITTGDYTLNNTTASSVTITIPTGQTTGTATFKIVDDAAVEGPETATLTISSPSSGITLGSTTTQNITITDNDFPTVNLSVSTNAGTEAAATSITVTATASAAVSGAQTVNLAVTGTGITTGDYTLNNTTASSITITIPTGQTTGTATFKIVDDAAVEGPETAVLTISTPSSGISLGSTTTQNITITDNDFPTVNLSVSANAGTEAAATSITVTATASAAVSGAQTVNLAVTGTGITAGDYSLSSTTITIPTGQTTGTVTFTVVDDALVEGTETAVLTISSPSSGISLGSTTTQNIAITDNDVAFVCPTLAATGSAGYDICSGNNTGDIALTSTRNDLDMKLVYFTSAQSGTAMYTGGTAIGSTVTPSGSNSPYAVAFNNLSFPANTTSSNVTYYVYAILDVADAQLTDANCRPNVAFTVTVNAAGVGGTIGSVQPICTGTSPADLVLSGNTGNVVKWQKSTDMAFTSPTDITSTSTTLTGATIGYLTASTYFRAVVKSGVCAEANSSSVLVTVNAPPFQLTLRSNSPQCERSGLSFESSVTSSGFFDPNVVFTYAWTGPNGFSAATANVTVSPLVLSNAGMYKLQVTNPQTGCFVKDSVDVVVFPLPAIPTITAHEMQMCKGENVLLTGTCSATTDIFRWTTPPLLGNSVATLSNINQRIITTPGVYKGLCESKDGCLSDEVSINITERSDCSGLNFITISPSKAAICPNGSVQLTASGCAGGTLTWTGGASPQTGTSITASPITNTTYFVQCSTGGSGSVIVAVAQPTIQVPNNIVTGQDWIKATQTITSDKKIGDANFTPAPSVLYEAGSSITLLPGFVAEKWSTFKAEIKGCN